MPSGKLTTTRPATIEQAPELPPALKLIYQLDPELAIRALAIMSARPDDGYNQISPDRAIAAALHEVKTGQVCGRDFYIDQRMGVVPGYRGVAREAKENGAGLWGDSYREFTEAEKAEHEVERDDQAYVCELTQYKAAEAAKNAGIEYHPRLGYGIVKAAEHKNSKGYEIKLAGGYTWVRKARNRALKDALRHAGLGDTAAQILEDAEIDASPKIKAYATLDQAAHEVRMAKFDADREARPEEVKEAERIATTKHQRRASYARAMGQAEHCPDCGAPLPNHLNTCEWFDFAPDEDLEDIPTAREERAAPPAPTPPGARIVKRVREAAEAWSGDWDENNRARARVSLTKLLPGDDNSANRKAVRRAFFGHEDYAGYIPGECMALKAFCAIKKMVDRDNPELVDWVPSDQALREVRFVLAEFGPQPELLPAEVTP